MKDYYAVLGISRSASEAQIKQAYRDLIKTYHPDVNRSHNAAEITREINEAYATLSDVQAKVAYDLDLRLAESEHSRANSSQVDETEARGDGTYAPTDGQRQGRHRYGGHRRASGARPQPAPNYQCETCGCTDASLRLSVTWRVFSFINYSRKSPTVRILCNACRVKESLYASAFTFLFGWWSIIGFFWTLESLGVNALGGDQPPENNATLLYELGYQMYRAERFQDAYEALHTSYVLVPDPAKKEALEFLKSQCSSTLKQPFWKRFWTLKLHPLDYHGPIGAVTLGLLLVIGGNALNEDSTAVSSSSGQPSAESRAESAFSAPEQPRPKQGPLNISADMKSYRGDTAPLVIATNSNDGDYVMKVESWSTGKPCATYFIPRGSTLKVELPLGDYKLKFASGDKWYGPKLRFGPDTDYSYVPDKMVFDRSGNRTRGHRIELIRQVGGNLETPSMGAEDW